MEENSEEREPESVEDELDLLLTVTENMWVQCDNPDCQKWRKIHKDASAKLDQSAPWFCHMNPDVAANHCSKQEDNQLMYVRVAQNAGMKFVMSELEIGDLVWAKTVGFCKWPAVISPDPILGLHVQKDQDGDPFTYHVEYLGNPHTHCWVNTNRVELYGHRNNKTVDALQSQIKRCVRFKGKKGKKRGLGWEQKVLLKHNGLKEAVEEAESLLNMSKLARSQLLVYEFESPGLQHTDFPPQFEVPVKEKKQKKSKKCKPKPKSFKLETKSKDDIFNFTCNDTYLQGQNSAQISLNHEPHKKMPHRKRISSFVDNNSQRKAARRMDSCDNEAVVPQYFQNISETDNDTSFYDENVEEKLHADTMDHLKNNVNLDYNEGSYNNEDFERMMNDLQDDIGGASLHSQEVGDLQMVETLEFSYFTPKSTHESVPATPEKSPFLLDDMESDLTAMEGFFMDN